MISDEERNNIVERIHIENEIRRKLIEDEGSKSNPGSWLESKLGILVMGAILTGVLVPTFQATQETIKWTRQNRYDNFGYRIDSVRSTIKELTVADLCG